MFTNIQVMRWDGELEREVWDFHLAIANIVFDCCIRFDAYSFQTRESTRHRKWTKQKHWQWLMQRDNNMDKPNFIPPDVIVEVQQRILKYILALPIQ